MTSSNFLASLTVTCLNMSCVLVSKHLFFFISNVNLCLGKPLNKEETKLDSRMLTLLYVFYQLYDYFVFNALVGLKKIPFSSTIFISWPFRYGTNTSSFGKAGF